MNMTPLVGILLGSRNDLPFMEETVRLLQQLGIEYEMKVLSAHRQPEAVREYALSARARGLEVIIAGAGLAGHLPGVLASWSDLPVIGVPLSSGELRGLDALYSMAQMPPGVPVATVAIGGARNAALLAARILGLKHERIRKAHEDYRRGLAQVEESQ